MDITRGQLQLFAVTCCTRLMDEWFDWWDLVFRWESERKMEEDILGR